MCYRMNHIKFSLKGRKNQFDKGNKNKVKKETWKKMTLNRQYRVLAIYRGDLLGELL